MSHSDPELELASMASDVCFEQLERESEELAFEASKRLEQEVVEHLENESVASEASLQLEDGGNDVRQTETPETPGVGDMTIVGEDGVPVMCDEADPNTNNDGAWVPGQNCGPFVSRQSHLNTQAVVLINNVVEILARVRGGFRYILNPMHPCTASGIQANYSPRPPCPHRPSLKPLTLFRV